MPEYIKQASEINGVVSDYESRPAYQQNDYIGWIERAKKQKSKKLKINVSSKWSMN